MSAGSFCDSIENVIFLTKQIISPNTFGVVVSTPEILASVLGRGPNILA
jgi:hypothetical protein